MFMRIAIERALWAVLACCLVVSAQAPPWPQTPPPPPMPAPQKIDGSLAIRAGRLFDGKSDSLRSNQVILIQGDKIAAVGPASEVKIPEGTPVLDLSGATVLPGLIDAHTHVFASGPDLDTQFLKESLQYRTLEALVNAQRDLYVGFTTLRDLKSLGGMYGDVDLRKAIDSGLVQGPRMQVSGRGIQTTGGFRPKGFSPLIPLPTMLQLVKSPSEAREAVREQIEYGADWIKFYAAYDFSFTPDGKMFVPPTFTFEEVQAMVEEAHDKGHKVSCHAFGGKGLHNCLQAGVDTLEHGVDLTDGDIQELKTKGIYLVPTLYHYQLDREHDLKRFGGHCVAEFSEPSFHRAVAAGVKIAFGTGVGPFPHGTQIKEFEYMVKFGMSPAQAIRAATSVAAQLMGWGDRIGSLERGKFADVVAFSGDPLHDITELERVKFVMKGGQIIRNDFGQGMEKPSSQK